MASSTTTGKVGQGSVQPQPAPPAAPAAPTPSNSPGGTGLVWTIRHLVVCLLLTAFAVGSGYGRVVADTKLDLVENPVGFLHRALTLWDPNGAGGQLQNQAYGYLFPIGPFYAVASWLHIPGWVTQRLWWALILCVAYSGVVGLARRLGIGTPASRMVAGAAFATSAHLLTVLGPVSAEALPMALSAWVLIPLVEAGRGASIRRCAAGSGLAVLCMGGVNAALTLAAVLPAVLWLLTRQPTWRWARLCAAWTACVGLACTWWVFPLLLLGRYSPPFLDYIESASTTTRTTTLVEALRGTSDWVAYLPESGWTAGLLLLTMPSLIVLTTVGAAAGLVGLARSRSSARSWLLLSLAVGVTFVTLGHVGSIDGFLAPEARGWLDGALAPIRNVHKFDVLIRLPIALGMAALVDARPVLARRQERQAVNGLVTVALAFVVLGSASPLVAMGVAPSGSFSSVPEYWAQAATWLRGTGSGGRALLLPGSRFGVFDWGVTKDEPIQPLAISPWDVRNAVPLTPAGHVRWLDDIERHVASGLGGAVLADDLRSAGVQYLVVRNDLDYGLSVASDPISVHQTLGRVPGLRRVAVFGPGTTPGGRGSVVYDSGRKVSFPALEIYALGGVADPRVTLTDSAQVVGLAGGPEAAGAAGGSVPGGVTPTVDPGIQAALEGRSAGPLILTDTPRRREANFGAGPTATSQTLTEDDPLRLDKPRRDYGVASGTGRGSEPREVVARLTGARSVTASTSASDADSLDGSDPATMPYSAVDGDPLTSWRPNPGTVLGTQWLQIDLGASRPLRGTTVGLPRGSRVSAVLASVDGSPQVATPVSGEGLVTLALPRQDGRLLRITLRGAASESAGVAEIRVRGVTITRTLVVPPLEGSRAPTTILLSANGERPGCAFLGDRPMCAADRASLGEDAAGLDRIVTIPGASDYQPVLGVTPGRAEQVTRVLGDVLHPVVSATASSSLVDEAADSAAAAVDGDLASAWLSDPADPDPTIRLAWKGLRTISSFTLELDAYTPATRPMSVVVETAQGLRQAPVGRDGLVSFAAVRTSSVAIHLRADALRTNYDPVRRAYTHLGLGVSELVVPGLQAVSGASERAVRLATPVTLGCGLGPDLVIDGAVMRTRVDTTVGAMWRHEVVTARPCGPAAVSLGPGTHRLQVPSTPLWAPSRLELNAPQPPTRSDTTRIAVRSWAATARALEVGPRSVPMLLTVHENENAGWAGTLAGRPLARVTVGGWQQGYLLPPGAGGVVRLSFAPQRWMAGGLAVGACAVLALLGLAFRTPGGSRGRRGAPIPAGRAAWPVVGGLVVMAAAGGVVGMLLAGVVLAARAVRVRRFEAGQLAYVGALALVSAGLLLAAHPALTEGYAAGSRLLQVLCLGAVAAVVFSPARPLRTEPGVEVLPPHGLDGSPAAPPSGS